jgi:alanyl-tRNA synthetase
VTERLYYRDAMLREFDAVVASCTPASTGTGVEVVLDRTAFYPTSGGQPFDTGSLGAARVVDVIDREDGEVVHIVEQMGERTIETGARVQATIDWPRRFDHMQQHTGQHVLSAAFDRLFNVRTVSFHLGAETATIDLAREVTPREAADAEEAANAVVWENREIFVRFVSEAEAQALPLRKDPARKGELRVVEVAGFDLSACGGTHVPATGMIGVIAVAATERFKGATRLTFVCGGRALRSHGRLRDAVTRATRVLSVLPEEIGDGIERLQAALKDADRAAKKTQEELAGFRAEGFRASAATIGPWRGVLSAQPGSDAGMLKTLAAAIVSEPGYLVVLTGTGTPVPVVAARSADVTFDAGAWMKQTTAALGGRGGGRPEMAQGGLDATSEQVLDFARRTLTDR